MKKILFTIILLLTLVMSGCRVDHSTVLIGTIYNHSSVPITILFYNDGRVYSTDTVRLNVNDSIQLGRSVEMGDIKAPLFFSDFIKHENYYAEIIYDNKYIVYHWGGL